MNTKNSRLFGLHINTYDKRHYVSCNIFDDYLVNNAQLQIETKAKFMKCLSGKQEVI